MNQSKLKLDLNESSSEPKYKQLAQSITENIELGHLKPGDQLPSITQLSIDYLVSRDTVEKAYKILRQQGVIESVKGKGFYVLISSPKSKLRVFVLFNKLSSYKKVIYNTLAYELREKANLELFVYHCNLDLFESYISDKVGRYNYYVIMSHFDTPDKARIATAINNIPPDKLILLDNIIEGVDKYKGAVYQDFKADIYEALNEGLPQLKKYKKIIFIFPENVPYPYPKLIVDGFKRFCAINRFSFEVLNELDEDHTIEHGTAYLLIEENDLAELIKKIRSQGLVIAKDIGIISYNDTPLKEVLLAGISVVTTDFQQLGANTAKIILNQLDGEIKNNFKLILRNTL
ncbi:MAG: GntR family transcriptional regulator [Cyclobacteriaceae bacterium]